ncbi:MAG TPA: glycosyltransferase [Stellaceae bacterium]|jgi:glycosyltransferase involved in cell wall biosynthesis|nr:glycosyltransferase [Stellaceae bacterium]
MSDAKRKLIFLVTEDWYFWSHRLPMARAAQQAGFEVAVATRVAAHGDRIKAAGFRLIPMRWRREEIGLFASLAAVAEIYRLYRRERPFMVHHVAHKAAILGGIAALLVRVPRIVSFIAGVGYMGTSRSRHAQLVGAAARLLWPVLLLRRHCRVIVQNDDDRAVIAALRPGAAERIVVIRGSGVDLDHFQPLPEPPEPPVTAAYVGRMLAIKGVATLVEAQRLLHADGIALQLLLAGTPDLANPSSFTEATLREWSQRPGVIWYGQSEDVREIWAAAHIAALASNGGEGVPKTLLEAAAAGRAIVATDVPGNRDIARHGINAILVPPGDAHALAAALKSLADDPAKRRVYAAAGRKLAAEGFSEEAVSAATVALYRELSAAV